jgi:hypothetical protein
MIFLVVIFSDKNIMRLENDHVYFNDKDYGEINLETGDIVYNRNNPIQKRIGEWQKFIYPKNIVDEVMLASSFLVIRTIDEVLKIKPVLNVKQLALQNGVCYNIFERADFQYARMK